MARHDYALLRRGTLLRVALLMLLPLAVVFFTGSCASLRVTDPERTASQEFLENVASTMAVDKLSTAVLRDRKVYIETQYLSASTQPSDEQQYMLGELRSKLLLNGVRLVNRRENSEIVMEVRSQGISIDRIEFLLGIPTTVVSTLVSGGVSATTPELAIVKTTKQHGFASVAYIAYWTDSGEVVASSGPFVGYTIRDDWWFFGFGPQTIGNIPPALPPPGEAGGPTTQPTKSKPVEGFKGKGPASQ